jgi:predicted transcriptional regulator
MQTKLLNIPVAMDKDFLAAIDTAAAELNDSRSGTMRRAIRAGLPLVTRGGESVRMSGAVSDFVGELAKHYNRTRESILVEAVERGIRAVEAHAMYNAPEGKEMGEGMIQAMLGANPDTQPLRIQVLNAKRERGALAIQLADLLQHCPEAQERKEVMERHLELYRAVYGSWPSMVGSGVSTAELQKQIIDERTRRENLGAVSTAELKKQIVDLESKQRANAPQTPPKQSPKKAASR